MSETATSPNAAAADANPVETAEWLESLQYALTHGGPQRVQYLLAKLSAKAHAQGVELPFTATTPYVNTIPVEQQPLYPGNRQVEWRNKSYIRWNAMAMVVRANRESAGIGGHISTYASAATLYEVGFNHFFRARGAEGGGDVIFFQGHASPGIYARAFVEGRISEQQLKNFRRELADGGGLSSYPHPWLMPSFWEFPTVSMGLGPIMAIYQARFMRYLSDRGLADTSGSRVWAFLGDGECDEPETLGAITLASREHLDNLNFVINCNLQRLDGPVRGNGKIIQELEGIFRGAGWQVIKVIWGDDWDPLLAADTDGLLVQRMGEVVDGQYQKYTVSPGSYIRDDFFGTHPQLREMVSHLSDEKLQRLRRGGHDPEKVYAAYKLALESTGRPTVILAKTVKGYGMGEAGEGRNITHQQKKLNEAELREFRTRFGIPISDEDVASAPFYRPADDSREMIYLRQQREALGGYVPARQVTAKPLVVPAADDYDEFFRGSAGREVSTTMAYVRMLARMLRDDAIGKRIVPIVPDESRTFGMEALFRQCGIYSHLGQLYEPVDATNVLYYREAIDGQILEEGITEAGAMSSFIAAGTAHVTHGQYMVPMFIYYSMFGFQRIGDLIWAAADARARGFLLGGTAGRTSLAGEGLQHQDGHSLLNAVAFPTVRAYDPAFAYETAVILLDGLQRMYVDEEEAIYYITLGNEAYEMPPMPADATDGIIRGIYKYRSYEVSERSETRAHVRLFGSGAILNEVLRAQRLLGERYGIASDVYSVTSYNELRRDAHAAERWNMLHPTAPRRAGYFEQLVGADTSPVIAASDYVRAVPEQLNPWVPGGMTVLGTDGMGRSDARAELRRFFEVDAECIVIATLYRLAKGELVPVHEVEAAIGDLDVDPEKVNPLDA